MEDLEAEEEEVASEAEVVPLEAEAEVEVVGSAAVEVVVDSEAEDDDKNDLSVLWQSKFDRSIYYHHGQIICTYSFRNRIHNCILKVLNSFWVHLYKKENKKFFLHLFWNYI